MFSSFVPDSMSTEPGPSRLRPDSVEPAHSSDPPTKLKKRRRLQFTSQIRNSVQRYNPDGTETVEYLHQQSTQRLKRKWDSIFERFKDAHLQEQDEIYLGNRANGEPIVVVKDRGSLRSLRQDMEFGVFIKDGELQGWKDRPEARGMRDEEDEDEEDFDPSHMPVHQRHFMGASSSESEDEEDDPAANDPDLREFLQAEAQRKAMLGKGGEDDQEEEEDEDVIDFSDPTWANQQASRSVFIPSPNTATSTNRPTKPAPTRSLIPQPDLAVSSSEGEDDTDVVTIHSDSDEELIDSIQTKRQNIEELLQCTTPFETLPYNDIFGLADLLKITDNSSRLYVDLVSDDEDQIVPQQAPAEDVEPAAPAVIKEDVIDLTSSLPNTVIDVTSSLPNTVIDITSSLPNSSSIVVDVISSPVSSRGASRASSLEPAAPGSERSMTPDESSSVIALIQTPRRDAAAMLPPSSIPSLRSTQPSQPELAEAGPSTPPLPQTAAPSSSPAVVVAELSLPLPQTAVPSLPSVAETRPASPSVAEARPSSPPAVVSATRVSPAPAPAPQTARATATPTPPPAVVEATPPRRVGPVPPAPADSLEAAIESEPSHSTPARPTSHQPTQSQPATKSAIATPPPLTSISASTSAPSLVSSTPFHDKHTSSHRKHSRESEGRHRHRRSSHSKRHDFDALDSGAEKVRKKKKCGGPGKCKKTFCLDCASLTRS